MLPYSTDNHKDDPEYVKNGVRRTIEDDLKDKIRSIIQREMYTNSVTAKTPQERAEWLRAYIDSKYCDIIEETQ